MLRTAAILCAMLGASIAAAGDGASDWRSWRGPLMTGAHPSATPPLTWSEKENIRWKIDLPGSGHSTPIVDGDRIFVTAAVPYGDEIRDPKPDTAPGAHDNALVRFHYAFTVFAIDRRDGRVVWEKTVAKALPHEGGHVSGSFASHSPVTDGELVVAFFGSRGLWCLDRGGEVLWSKDLGAMQTLHGHGEGASPVLAGGIVVVNFDHEGPSFIAAFDAKTGEPRWRKDRDEVTSWATPIVIEHAGRKQVVVSGTKRTRGYDLVTGDVIWECGGLSSNVVASPVHEGGVVFVGSSYEKQAMMAIRLAGASGDITGTERVLWTRHRQTPYVPSPLLYDGSLYFLRHYQNILYRVDALSGREVQAPLRLIGIGNIYASPVAAAGKVYVTDRDGATIVIAHGAEPRMLALNSLDDRVNASLAIAGDEIYIRGERHLYSIGAPKDAE